MLSFDTKAQKFCTLCLVLVSITRAGISLGEYLLFLFSRVWEHFKYVELYAENMVWLVVSTVWLNA